MIGKIQMQNDDKRLKKLIAIEGEIDFQCNSKKELVERIIDSNFYSLTEKEKNEKLKMLAIANCIGEKNCKISTNSDGNFIIKDETTYILSLLIMNKIILLERTDANVFLENMDKSNINSNYMIVNKFAQQLLIDYLKERE